MNKEQIESLTKFIEGRTSIMSVADAIEIWFEQNPIEPTVVGLTDEQVEGFMTFWADSPSSDYIGLYKKWAKTQTFAHCNNEGKVYELDGTVTDYKADYYRVLEDFFALEKEYSKLLEQPVVVGLTDEQVWELSKYLIGCTDDVISYEKYIENWLKTQTFAQSRVFTDSEIQQKYMELYDDYQSLLVDKQMLEPTKDFYLDKIDSNVRLYHAAPDLLAALVDIMKWHDNEGHYCNWIKARAAIAKATQ